MKSAPLAAAALAAVLFAAPALAEVDTDAISAALLAENTAVRPGEPFRAGVLLKMDRGWHTYWKNPGDAGFPTQIEWKLPDGFTHGPVEWPAPRRYEDEGTVTYGYEGQVLLAAEIRPPAGLAEGGKARLEASVVWLGCKELCVPGKAEVSLELPVSASAAPEADFARRRVPPPPALAWKTAARSEGTTLFLEMTPPPAVKKLPRSLYFYPEDENVVEYGAPQHLENAGGRLVLRLDRSPAAMRAPDRLRGVVAGKEGWSGAPGAAFSVDVPFSQPVS